MVKKGLFRRNNQVFATCNSCEFCRCVPFMGNSLLYGHFGAHGDSRACGMGFAHVAVNGSQGIFSFFQVKGRRKIHIWHQ